LRQCLHETIAIWHYYAGGAERYIDSILFREECVFKRELKFSDDVAIRIKLLKATTDFSAGVF
jgi:acyl-CoA thioesterase FadM